MQSVCVCFVLFFSPSHFQHVHCTWWLSLKSHQCLLIVHFFLCLFVFFIRALISQRDRSECARVAFPFQMNILLLFKGGMEWKWRKKTKNKTNYNRLQANQLRNRWSTRMMSEHKWKQRVHTKRMTNNQRRRRRRWRKKHTSILKWNAFKMRKQISFILDIFHHCPVVSRSVVCKLFFLVNVFFRLFFFSKP